MIDLPDEGAPSGCEPSLMDFGILLRPASGAAVQKVDRAGSRWKMKVTLPPMTAANAAIVSSALTRGIRQGLRMDVPLLGRSQGYPGTPVVNGANPTGTSLPIRGMPAGYVLQVGFWLTLVDGSGNYYLHQVAVAATASAVGQATVTIEPPIRAALADGATILLARPKVQGWISSEHAWSMQPGELVAGFSFTLEEAA